MLNFGRKFFHMDKMSLFSILTVTVPEVILDIYVAFVLTGQRNKLYLDDKLNILRLSIVVILFSATEVITRAYIFNLGLVVLSNILIFSIVFKFIYKIKWSESFLCSVIIFGTLITIELFYMVQFMSFVDKNISNYYSNDVARFVLTIPERIIQIIIIASFWKWDLVYLNIRNKKNVLPIAILFIILLISSEVIFMYAFTCNINEMSTSLRILCSIGSLLFALVNFLFCKLIVTLSK